MNGKFRYLYILYITHTIIYVNIIKLEGKTKTFSRPGKLPENFADSGVRG